MTHISKHTVLSQLAKQVLATDQSELWTQRTEESQTQKSQTAQFNHIHTHPSIGNQGQQVPYHPSTLPPCTCQFSGYFITRQITLDCPSSWFSPEKGGRGRSQRSLGVASQILLDMLCGGLLFSVRNLVSGSARSFPTGLGKGWPVLSRQASEKQRSGWECCP